MNDGYHLILYASGSSHEILITHSIDFHDPLNVTSIMFQVDKDHDNCIRRNLYLRCWQKELPVNPDPDKAAIKISLIA
jgi:hypothetical protein